MALDPNDLSDDVLTFLRERHLATLTTLRDDANRGRPGDATVYLDIARLRDPSPRERARIESVRQQL